MTFDNYPKNEMFHNGHILVDDYNTILCVYDLGSGSTGLAIG